MTDATDTPQAPQAAAETATPAVEAAAPAAAGKRSLLFHIGTHFRAIVPPRLLPIGAATAFGVLGGVAATSGYYERFEPVPPPQSREIAALGESVRRLETNIGVLSTTVGTSSKTSSTQFAKLGERIDKVEKSLAEPNSRLAALSEAIEKLRGASAKAAPSDVTGTVAAAPKPAEPQKPILSTWTLHEVDRGVATVESRQGIFEVEVGDPLPGLDRVEAIRREGGRWTVVTRKGIIVAR